MKSIDCINENEETALKTAMENRNINIIKLILPYSKLTHSYLEKILKMNDLELFRMILNKKTKKKVLEYALINKNEDILLIINEKYRINEKLIIETKTLLGSYNDNILTYSCRNGFKRLLKKLIENEYNLNVVSVYKTKTCYIYNAAFIAYFSNNYEILDILIDNEIDLNFKIKKTEYSQKSSIKLNENSNYAMEFYESKTLLMMLCMVGNDDILETLVDAGSNLEEKDNVDRTALIIACENGNLPAVKYLVDHGANIHSTDDKNRTSIMISIHHNQTEIIKYLIEMDQKNEFVII